MTMNSHYCLLPEWDNRVNAVLLSYPARHTDWNYILEEARCCFDEIISTLVLQCGIDVIVIGDYHTLRARFGAAGFFNSHIHILDIDYNDTWARDYGPLTLSDSNANFKYSDFKFNGWGLKYRSDFDNQICRMLSSTLLTRICWDNHQDFILEGGSIEYDGNGTILTTSSCLLSPNRNGAYTKEDIEKELKIRLGAQNILWLNHGQLEGDDTDGHIDTIARFVSSNTIAYIKCGNMMDNHYHELSLMENELRSMRNSEGRPYELVPLPFPNPIYDEESNRLPATYANFLILPHHVLVPTYNQPTNDTAAISILQNLFPHKEIIGIDCSTLIKQHGSLHCVTMQMII